MSFESCRSCVCWMEKELKEIVVSTTWSKGYEESISVKMAGRAARVKAESRRHSEEFHYN